MTKHQPPAAQLRDIAADLGELDTLTLDRAALAQLAELLTSHTRLFEEGIRTNIAARTSIMRTAQALEWALGRDHLITPDPLPEVPTLADVTANPTYWISGPGRLVAEQTRCPHNYRLTDSCPGCDADAEDDEQ